MDWSVVVVLAVVVSLALYVWVRSEDAPPVPDDDPSDTGDSGYRP